MDKYLDFRNLTVHYKVEGSGTPVILIHGFCEDGTIWEQITKALKQDYLLIIPDLPGYGESTLSPRILSMDELGEIIHRILNKENIKKAIIVGHSMGGYVSLAFADKYPEEVMGLVLFHSHPFPDTDEIIRQRRRTMEFIKRHDSHQFINEYLPTLFTDEFVKNNFKLLEKLEHHAYGFHTRALVDSYHAMIKREDKSHVLQQAAYPVLFIIGKQDKIIPFEKSMEQTHLPKKAKIHVMENVGHMGMIEAPEESINVLKEFFEVLKNQPVSS